MAREFDTRKTSTGTPSIATERAVELRRIAAATSDGLPGDHRVAIGAFDEATGNPSLVVSHGAGATGRGAYVDCASAHLESLSPALGVGLARGLRYRVDPAVVTTSSGAAAVHAQQEYKGILVFQASEVVLFTPTGSLESTSGQCATIDQDYSPVPTLSSVAATVAAAQFVATPGLDEAGATDQFGEPMRSDPVDLCGFSPKVVSEEDGAERRTFLGGEPLTGTISASLIWFPLGGDLRLTWQVVLTLPTAERWRVLVDASEGRRTLLPLPHATCRGPRQRLSA